MNFMPRRDLVHIALLVSSFMTAVLEIMTPGKFMVKFSWSYSTRTTIHTQFIQKYTVVESRVNHLHWQWQTVLNMLFNTTALLSTLNGNHYLMYVTLLQSQNDTPYLTHYLTLLLAYSLRHKPKVNSTYTNIISVAFTGTACHGSV
jgi:hypothetical protein